MVRNATIRPRVYPPTPIHPLTSGTIREHPCPPGGCDFEAGHVLVKLAPGVEVVTVSQQESGQFTGDATLDAAMSSQGIIGLNPIFPNAQPPQLDEQIIDPDGQPLPKPDLTRWYIAAFENSTARRLCHGRGADQDAGRCLG